MKTPRVTLLDFLVLTLIVSAMVMYLLAPSPASPLPTPSMRPIPSVSIAPAPPPQWLHLQVGNLILVNPAVKDTLGNAIGAIIPPGSILSIPKVDSAKFPRIDKASH